MMRILLLVSIFMLLSSAAFSQNSGRVYFYLSAQNYGDGQTNGIASAITACGTVNPCVIIVPSTYPATELVPGANAANSSATTGASTSSNIEIWDFRAGFNETAVNP